MRSARATSLPLARKGWEASAIRAPCVDSLPPAPVLAPQSAPAGSDAAPATPSGRGSYGVAPGDIYPRGAEQRRLCGEASTTDWAYLGALLGLDAGAITLASLDSLQNSTVLPARFVNPLAIGVTWGATVGGAWLALPKCSPEWVGEAPREGGVRLTWPVALSLALLAGATAPVINAIVEGYDTSSPWSTFEREMHIVTAGVAGFGGALIPYLLPPRTWAAARELDRIRFGSDGRGTYFIGYFGEL